jgi:hypothetical protein
VLGLWRLQRHLPDQAQLRRDTGAELILIILLLGGIIYATFASNPMSFDDLIELRFLPSRRRHRDPEYFEQLKSMRSQAVGRSSTRESPPTHPHRTQY